MKEALRWLAVLTLLAATGCARDKTRLPPPADPGLAAPDDALPGTQPLFIIERSKNANTVHYDARLTADGNLDPQEPVIAYYIMLAEDGRRKELSLIEKAMAYGFAIRPDPSVSGYAMTMVAAPGRSITVKKVGRTVRAELIIDGRPAVLEKMYINASDGPILPVVHFIELYGKDPRTGEPRYEKVLPQ